MLVGWLNLVVCCSLELREESLSRNSMGSPVESGRHRKEGQGMNGCRGGHQGITADLLGFRPVGKHKEASPGLDKLLWSHVPTAGKNLQCI